MPGMGWDKPELDAADLERLRRQWKQCAADVVRTTSLAGCGHPGGSLSSLHALQVAYDRMNVDPRDPNALDRDRFFVSIGHISPGVYSVLAANDFMPRSEVLLGFRRTGSPYSGHVEPNVPGVEWSTGNLGQGFSAAVGAALATKVRGSDSRTFCLMGDGEQQKGQIAEARRFAVKFGLTNLVGLIDVNRLQIGGATADVMPQDHAADWAAAGWNVIEVAAGNDHQAVYAAMRRAVQLDAGNAARPTVLLLHTVMGSGLPDIEDQAKYHGQALEPDKAAAALTLLDADNDLKIWADRRAKGEAPPHRDTPPAVPVTIAAGVARDYTPDNPPDNRAAYGNVLADLAELNNLEGAAPKVVALTCDLEGSVKMDGFHKKSPHAFFEAGIQEHAAASIAGRLSREGYLTFFSTFGVFGVDEVYNQLRINDFNQSQLKVVCTHVGLSVGEDGPTHQCIDYLALLGALPGFRLIVPADANQTDRVIRYIAQAPGNFFVGLPRAKAPTICNADGTARYAGDYTFTPGEADLAAPGADAAICAIGPMVGAAMEARGLLADAGIDAAVWNFASVDPLPADAVREAAKTGVIVTVEDHGVWGGLGSRIAEQCVATPVVLRKMGVRGYQTSGPATELYAAAGLSPAHIAQTVMAAVTAKQGGGAAFPSEAAAAAW